MDKTDLPEVVDVDAENKKEIEEEDYWVWQGKVEARGRLPIMQGHPDKRSFSTDKTAKKRRHIPVIKHSESSDEDKMNKTTRVISSAGLDSAENEE